MAVSKKKKKFLGFVIVIALIGFFVRPLVGKYYNVNGAGSLMDLSPVKRTGLFSVSVPGWSGVVGLFGSAIYWTRESDGAKDSWVRK